MGSPGVCVWMCKREKARVSFRTWMRMSWTRGSCGCAPACASTQLVDIGCIDAHTCVQVAPAGAPPLALTAAGRVLYTPTSTPPADTQVRFVLSMGPCSQAPVYACMHMHQSTQTYVCAAYTCTRIPANRQMSRVCLASNANTTQCTKRTWLQGFGGVSLQTMGLIGGLSAGALLLLCAIMLFLWSVNNIHLCATSYLFVSVCLFAKACARAHTHIIFRNQEAARGARVGS